MTNRFFKCLSFVTLISLASMVSNELDAAPIRSVSINKNRNLQKQQRWNRFRSQANRRVMQPRPYGSSSPAITSASISGIRGASSNLSTAAMSLGDSVTASTQATWAPQTLEDLWLSLRADMRFADQLKPDPTTGLLPDTPFVADLQNRRALNQARFDTYHPLISQMMDWDGYIRNNGSPSDLNPASRPPSTTNPQVVIPEPSSVIIGLTLIGFAAWRRHAYRTI